MISIIKLKEVMNGMVADLNNDIPDQSNQIGRIFFSPTESHFVKRLGDSRGIVIGVKMPDIDTETDNEDNYSEQNHSLLYLLEKTDPGKYSEEQELERYDYLQELMRKIKQWLWENLAYSKLGNIQYSKSFHTEWEYQVKGGWNGLSLSFDLEDYTL